MNIRAKLCIGYLVFTATLVVLGGWSAWHLREMGGVSRNIIANNYDSTASVIPGGLPEGARGASEHFLRLEPLINRLRGDCVPGEPDRGAPARVEGDRGPDRGWRPRRQGAVGYVDSRDEVGMLAAGFNTMAERIRQSRRSDLGRLVVAQHTTEAAIDSLYDPVIITDAERAVTKLNPAAEELSGSEASNIGKPVGVIARDSRIPVAVSEALSSQRPVAGEGAASVLPLDVWASRTWATCWAFARRARPGAGPGRSVTSPSAPGTA